MIARIFQHGGALLLYAMIAGLVRDHPGRTALTVLAIALGVALGVSVHLVNASALNEFELAARQLAGEADVVISGPRAGFDEQLYPRLARLPGVVAANPAVELDATVAGAMERIKILGLDPLRAAQVQPLLMPQPSGMVPVLLDADAVLLSVAAAQWLDLKAGDALRVHVGTRVVEFKVAGLLPQDAYRQRIAIMDIAAAQWRFERLGRLNRIDLRLEPGTDVAAFRTSLQSSLPAGVHALTPQMDIERGANFTRAYRINLDMLALIALFTGAFLVFSSQALAMLRRRRHLALLRVLGVTRRSLAARLIAEGALIGVAGSSLGVILGYVVAWHALAWVGADLGAGYYRAISASPAAAPAALAAFFVLGIAFAVLGAAAPAIETAQRPPAAALRAGDEEESLRSLNTPWWGLAAIAASAALTMAPALDDVPVAGYAAIAFLLLGTVLAMPQLVRACLHRIPLPPHALAATAIAQLKAVPRQTAVSVAAIVISFSLMVSMLVMVSSFRTSLETWLDQMLPADIYLRAARGGETGFLTTGEQAAIAATPGVKRVVFLRSQTLLLDPRHLPVTLLARPIDTTTADQTLPLLGRTHAPRADGPPPVWVSEVAAKLLGLQPGDIVPLPIGETPASFVVAGVWRDYARQNGAILIDRSLYIQLTGDLLANDAAIWGDDRVRLPALRHALRETLGEAAGVELATTREVREASLAAFDRTFAITYALEFAAVAIGLFGIGVSFSAQALARRREFGMFRHLGMTKREIGAMLAGEGAFVAALGAAIGLAAGSVAGLILIHVVNRQSFHWSMEFSMPWLTLGGLGALIVAAAAGTAVWSGRAAMQGDVVRAVREDW